jgi:anaerobic selenocysteine-containing dehydrogenase
LYEEIPLSDREPIGADRFPVLYRYRKQCHSMTAMDYMLGQGKYPLRGMIMTGTNPVITNPNAGKTSEALAGLDLLVVRDLFLTESARQAHFVLPAATFLERSELHYYLHLQMVGLATKILDVSGVTDEYTFWRDLARRLDLGDKYFPWENEDEVNEYILGMTPVGLEALKQHPEGYVYAHIELEKHRTRPFPTETGKFQFTSGYLKGLGYPETPEYIPPQNRPGSDGDYPFVLITGARYRQYYHSRYRNIEGFRKAVPRAELEIHPKDAAGLGIGDKERVKVISPIGSIEIETKIVREKDILPGVVQIGHGWDDPNVNVLTDDRDVDPISGYPNMKVGLVDVRKIL